MKHLQEFWIRVVLNVRADALTPGPGYRVQGRVLKEAILSSVHLRTRAAFLVEERADEERFMCKREETGGDLVRWE